MSLSDRFYAKVDRSGPCHVWLAALNSDGYPVYRDDAGRLVLAHRAAYEAIHGPVPAGLELDHGCDVRACIRVDDSHVRPLTHRANILRGSSPAALNAAKEVCLRGHPFDEENTYWDAKRRRRQCRACRRIGKLLAKIAV